MPADTAPHLRAGTCQAVGTAETWEQRCLCSAPVCPGHTPPSTASFLVPVKPGPWLQVQGLEFPVPHDSNGSGPVSSPASLGGWTLAVPRPSWTGEGTAALWSSWAPGRRESPAWLRLSCEKERSF